MMAGAIYVTPLRRCKLSDATWRRAPIFTPLSPLLRQVPFRALPAVQSEWNLMQFGPF